MSTPRRAKRHTYTNPWPWAARVSFLHPERMSIEFRDEDEERAFHRFQQYELRRSPALVCHNCGRPIPHDRLHGRGRPVIHCDRDDCDVIAQQKARERAAEDNTLIRVELELDEPPRRHYDEGEPFDGGASWGFTAYLSITSGSGSGLWQSIAESYMSADGWKPGWKPPKSLGGPYVPETTWDAIAKARANDEKRREVRERDPVEARRDDARRFNRRYKRADSKLLRKAEWRLTNRELLPPRPIPRGHRIIGDEEEIVTIDDHPWYEATPARLPLHRSRRRPPRIESGEFEDEKRKCPGELWIAGEHVAAEELARRMTNQVREFIERQANQDGYPSGTCATDRGAAAMYAKPQRPARSVPVHRTRLDRIDHRVDDPAAVVPLPQRDDLDSIEEAA
jgi:hypothetical protein